MTIYLPSIGVDELDIDKPADRQASLGAMMLLDLLDATSSSDSIAEYFSWHKTIAGNGATKILTDSSGIPIGYAAWIVESDCIELHKRVVPFTSILKLLRVLREILGKDTKVVSICKDSARARQQAW